MFSKNASVFLKMYKIPCKNTPSKKFPCFF